MEEEEGKILQKVEEPDRVLMGQMRLLLSLKIGKTDLISMMLIIQLGILFASVSFCFCQSSSLVIKVVEVGSFDDVKLICNVPSSTNVTRWTYLSGPTGTSLMSYQNGTCTVSPSDSFLSNDSRYLYTCNNTVYQLTIHSYPERDITNHILACRDADKTDGSGSTWMMKIVNDGDQFNGDQAMNFSVREVKEGDNVTFICRVSSGVPYVHWNINFRSTTAAMSAQNGQCTTQSTTFLDNTSKYNYTCNGSVYQVTILDVRRSEHNEMYMCTPVDQEKEPGSNWIIKVEAPITSVMMTPTNYLVNVKENTVIEFTCTTSTARPTASVYWYRHPNGNISDITQITENITTKTDYNDLSVITSTLHFVPQRQHSQTMIYCTANNSVNTYPVRSNKNIFLNILYKADGPYIIQGNEYHVMEHTYVTLTCTVRGGNPNPTLSWRCINFSPKHQSTINSKGNVTTTFTWNVTRTHEGTCTCRSQQTYFTTKTIDVSLVVLYEVNHLSFSINGLIDKVVTVNERSAVTFRCITDGNPPPTIMLINGTNVLVSKTSRQLEFNLSNVSCQDIGTYSCSARNELNVHTVISSIDLIVHCSPRHDKDMKEEILSGIGLAVEIVIEVFANPTPSFTWWSQVNDQWKVIQSSDRRLINSTGLLSSLTINSVNEDDFTNYKVLAENSVGNMEQIYKLRDGSPDMPTQLRYFEALSTSSSIQLAWDPGYNGGSTQIFFIKYKSTDESSWNYDTVSDDSEQTQIYTLTNLKDDMYYYIKVLAFNQYGNSSETSLLLARTKAIQPQPSTPDALIAGIAIIIVIGCIILLVVIRKCPLFKGASQFLACRQGNGTDQPNEENTSLNGGSLEDGTSLENDVTPSSTIGSETNGTNSSTEDSDYFVIQYTL